MAAPKAHASNAPTATFIFPSGSAATSSGAHATRRIVYPGRYNSGLYVAPCSNSVREASPCCNGSYWNACDLMQV